MSYTDTDHMFKQCMASIHSADGEGSCGYAPEIFLKILHANLYILVLFGIVWGRKQTLSPQYF